MKKVLFLLLSFTLIGFCSCSDDSDKQELQNVVGEWSAFHVYPYIGSPTKLYGNYNLTFQEGGTFTCSYYQISSEDDNTLNNHVTGRYEVTPGIKYKGGITLTCEETLGEYHNFNCTGYITEDSIVISRVQNRTDELVFKRNSIYY